ncbi:hypothetical protein SO802_034596 [Lithocarpus litseifolius]|uniref:Uncharacterized protein n=1 Tax=Lithocarpus litseifolius TaxID=425828 RepID=A0AAW2BGK0_9ROSI
MVRPCSRNTKIVNESNVPIRLEATWYPVRTLRNSVTIPPREHKFVCYRDFDKEGNRYRFVDIRFIAGNAFVNVLISDIRDHAKIVLNFDGNITFNPIRGSVIRRIGLSIMLNGAVKEIKSSVKQIGRNHVQAGIESYLFRVCYLIVHKPSPSLDKFVIDICSKSLKIALKVHWFLMAEIKDLDDNEGISRIQEKCQLVATLMGEWPPLIRSLTVTSSSPEARRIERETQKIREGGG